MYLMFRIFEPSFWQPFKESVAQNVLDYFLSFEAVLFCEMIPNEKRILPLSRHHASLFHSSSIPSHSILYVIQSSHVFMVLLMYM